MKTGDFHMKTGRFHEIIIFSLFPHSLSLAVERGEDSAHW